MKSLVLASYAQFGVSAGGRRNNYACGGRAVFNGMKIPTLPLWRPAVVQTRTPQWSKRRLYEVGCKPAMRCKGLPECCVQSSLPCVSRSGLRSGMQTPGQGRGMILPHESLLAKEDKSRRALWWKSPRLSFIEQIRDCSTDSVAIGSLSWQRKDGGFHGKPLHRRRGAASGEILPDLSRKLNLICCHYS